MKSSGKSSFGRIISSKLPYHNYTQTIIIVFCLHKILSLKGFWMLMSFWGFWYNKCVCVHDQK